MTLLRKLSLMMIALFAITSVFAESYDDSCPTRCEPEPPCPKACDVPAAPTMAAYNQQANIDVCGSWDFYVTGTFLWWQPIQEQMAYAETTYGAASALVGKVHGLSFDWKAAFKVGVGYNWGYDGWDSYLQYTRSNTSMSSSKTLGAGVNEVLHDLWNLQDLGLAKNKVTSKWDLDFNVFDLEFGRPGYFGTCLTLKPHFGLRGGWIDQSNLITSQDSDLLSTYEGTFTSKSWFVGPRAGIYTKWDIGEGFRFFGNAAVSAFAQKFDKVTVREQQAANASLWYRAQDLVAKHVNTSLDMVIGLAWGTYFDNNNWYFDLAIGYETQVWTEQNMMRHLQQMAFVTGDVTNVTKPGNLMFQGLNVTARFDF